MAQKTQKLYVLVQDCLHRKAIFLHFALRTDVYSPCKGYKICKSELHCDTCCFFIFQVLKLLKTAEGIRKLLDTVAEALPQVCN